ncbi:MAG: thioredoxin domain-containing protein [Chitinophagales bacterium]|nr:thioredoxin domain-containing protein [Chitinophagales bacterium]MDW8427534.1 thioredoxin domain-containing protein [Chitinophagales bacterium]
MKKPNRLIAESSPYLQQHAHNPVDWYPWGEEAWQRAKEENKLVLISIGYAACHWCHVMERECFEDPQVAEVMNQHFINIKVDREERPDVDQLYMLAVQLMTGSGGWPLNCFTLPDGRPVFGGTYFPKRRWLLILQQLAEYWHQHPADARQFADRLTEALRHLEQPLQGETSHFSMQDAQRIYEALVPELDAAEGGFSGAPKFALPNRLEFLLWYAAAAGVPAAAAHVFFTLRKMAFGGLYDHVGGGFARYATDARWHIPHFEKMLYDNAQLLSLYAKAYQLTSDPLFQDVGEQTFAFVTQELMTEAGALCSSLDADSEGQEGRYYVWTRGELKEVLGADFPLVELYYNINDYGHWEEGKYVLVRRADDQTVARQLGYTETELRQRLQQVRQKLLQARQLRPRPMRDDKEITSWAALMIKACCDAYEAWGKESFRDLALRQAWRIWDQFSTNHPRGLFHARINSRGCSPGFLDDYAFSADAFLSVYRITFDESWLNRAAELVHFADQHFYDEQQGLYYYSARNQTPLIVRLAELTDDVIPSSTSTLARVLLQLGRYLDNETMLEQSRRLLQKMLSNMLRYPMAYCNWAILLLQHVVPHHEVVIVGEEALSLREKLVRHFLPYVLLAGSTTPDGKIPIVQNRYVPQETFIYVCQNKACLMPVKDVNQALDQLMTGRLNTKKT